MSSSATRFMLCRIDNRIRVRRLVGEAMNKDCTHGNVAHVGGSVHVWGGISNMGKTSLWVLDQMSLEPFIAEFWRTTWFHMTGLWYRNNCLLADDNARPHRACVVDAYLHAQDISRMDWVPYRPDNLRQLGVIVQNKWQQIPLKESRPWLVVCHAESVL